MKPKKKEVEKIAAMVKIYWTSKSITKIEIFEQITNALKATFWIPTATMKGPDYGDAIKKRCREDFFLDIGYYSAMYDTDVA